MDKEELVDQEVEEGKKQILEHVKGVSKCCGLDPQQLEFTWRFEMAYTEWILSVFNGRKRNVIRIWRPDVEDWPRNPEIPQKYAGRILESIMQLAGV
jgi:hypothetical protein